jgi:hypothetical protein
VLGFPAVLDAKGRFLFAGGNNSIHMYQGIPSPGLTPKSRARLSLQRIPIVPS